MTLPSWFHQAAARSSRGSQVQAVRPPRGLPETKSPTVAFKSSCLPLGQVTRRAPMSHGGKKPILQPEAHESLLDKFITKNELAEHLNVSLSLINRLMAEERLPHIKIGRSVRFQLSKVLAWFEVKGYST